MIQLERGHVSSAVFKSLQTDQRRTEVNMLRRSLLAALAALPLALGSAAAKASDIVDTAASAGQFNTLVAAVKAAGLVETLKARFSCK